MNKADKLKVHIQKDVVVKLNGGYVLEHVFFAVVLDLALQLLDLVFQKVQLLNHVHLHFFLLLFLLISGENIEGEYVKKILGLLLKEVKNVFYQYFAFSLFNGPLFQPPQLFNQLVVNVEFAGFCRDIAINLDLS